MVMPDDDMVAGRPQKAGAGRRLLVAEQFSVGDAVGGRDHDAGRWGQDVLSVARQVRGSGRRAQRAVQKRQVLWPEGDQVPSELLAWQVEGSPVWLADAVASDDKRVAGEGQDETLVLPEDTHLVFRSSLAKIYSQDAVGPPLWQDSRDHGPAAAQILTG